METVASVLESMNVGEWMVSLDLRDQSTLVLASTYGPILQECIGTIQAVFRLCAQLSIQINLPKSDLVSSQRKQYLGMVLDSVRALVFPLSVRISQFLSVVQSFLEDRAPTVSVWRSLLGHLASLERPGTLLVSSMVLEETLEGSVKPILVAVSGRPLLVDGSGS
ncbi:hypothetical protein E2C01_055566 [Portunus trituberculatus]|uniref:Uncharacterized protein n=1 Tax=Portunus trituberculatus TaxID=210409 RepID=A0A5B7GV46_PORTR|nr:hypothetical protein [Portunus trituberculatus]